MTRLADRNVPPSRTSSPPPLRPRPSPRGSKRWLRPRVVVTLAVLALLGAGGYYVLFAPFTWREEVALHDGGALVLTWQVWFAAGEPGQKAIGRQQITFAHPRTGQAVVWEDSGKVGSRLNPTVLEIDAGRLFLVGLAQTGSDYDGFGCPTPPYIVFRYDAGTWVRVPLSELPLRLENANLVGFDAYDLIRQSQRYLTPARITAWYAGFPTGARYARVDRRLQNPLGFGCSRDALERIYGRGKYEEWLYSGTWLDKSESEALQLLQRKREGAKP